MDEHEQEIGLETTVGCNDAEINTSREIFMIFLITSSLHVVLRTPPTLEPLDYFSHLVNDSTIEEVVSQSNLFAPLPPGISVNKLYTLSSLFRTKQKNNHNHKQHIQGVR